MKLSIEQSYGLRMEKMGPQTEMQVNLDWIPI